jgi:hypothetical protein
VPIEPLCYPISEFQLSDRRCAAFKSAGRPI